MITAMTSSRIDVAHKLEDIRNSLIVMRSNVCLNNNDRDNLENSINYIDEIVNRVMKGK
jgi:hypothetical protein